MAYTKKRPPLLWTAAGLLLSLGVLLVVLGGLGGRTAVSGAADIPQAADAVMTCIGNGDWEALQLLVSGNPELAPATGEAASAENRIWDAYRQSLQWECAESYEIQGSHVTQQVTVTCLDIAAVTDKMAQILKGSAIDPENRAQALSAAAEQALAAEMPTIQREITLRFLRENGQWLLIPDNALLALLSGFTG